MTPLAAVGPTWAEVPALAPALVLVAGACLMLVLEVATRRGTRAHLPWLTVLTAAVAGYFAWTAAPQGAIFGGAALADGFSAFFAVLVCIALGLSALVASTYLQARGIERGEYYGLLCLSASGMVLLAMSADLVTMFVSLEVMSIATYALVAFRRDQERSAEAAFKYLVLGALSSAIFLYGSALLYVSTGGLKLADIARTATTGDISPLFLAGAGLATLGFAFKVAAVPFHMWTPDVYQGAPTPVTAFMAAGVKAAAFAALVRLLVVSLGDAEVAAVPWGWGQVVYWLSMATVVIGNLLALMQDNVKRMLAYSSIAHAGYALLAITASAWGGPTVTSSVLFYLLAYAVTAIGAFAVVAAVEKKRAEGEHDSGHIDELAGLSKRHPGLAFAMTVFMLSLAGVPPTGGFVAKLDVFRALFAAAERSPHVAQILYLLAIVSVLASVVGVYYYLRVVVWMYMKPAADEAPESGALMPLRVGVAVATLAVLVLGVLPGPFSNWAQNAVRSSFAKSARLTATLDEPGPGPG